MKPHEQRVVDEKAALDAKIGRLTEFIRSETYGTIPYEDRGLLCAQVHAMAAYSQVLDMRVNRFSK